MNYFQFLNWRYFDRTGVHFGFVNRLAVINHLNYLIFVRNFPSEPNFQISVCFNSHIIFKLK